MDWDIIETGPASPEKNMLDDRILLDKIEELSKPVLRFYDWIGDCATYGYFIDPFVLLNREGVKKRELHLAKRPTGGGVIFHTADLAFSMLIPAGHLPVSINPLENYAFVNQIVIEALTIFLNNDLNPQLLPVVPLPTDNISKHFCMAMPTKYDVIINGKKVGGGAQRRSKHGILHQGSLSIGSVEESLLQDVLLTNSDVLQEMKLNSYYLIDTPESKSQVSAAKNEIKSIFRKILGQRSCCK